ncbi:MAG: GNAT family N-acetyltransferase [Planctomycetota bacterium]
MIETARLILCPVKLEHAERIQVLINDKEIASNTRTIPYPYPEGAAEEWVRLQQANWSQGKAYVFSILLKSDPQFVGAIGLEVHEADENAELGYWLGRPYWNQGFCTEAAGPVVEYGFAQVGLHRIFAHHLTRNPASGRVLEKIGMKREGCLRGHVRKWGVFEDIEIYGQLASDRPD